MREFQCPEFPNKRQGGGCGLRAGVCTGYRSQGLLFYCVGSSVGSSVRGSSTVPVEASGSVISRVGAMTGERSSTIWKLKLRSFSRLVSNIAKFSREENWSDCKVRPGAKRTITR